MPHLRLFTRDWLSCMELRVCSTAARGLWIDMLCIMAGGCNGSYGYLEHLGGPLSDDQIAVLTGAQPAEVASLVAELESNGVFDRDERGVIFSRRLVADEKKRRECSEAGKKGGGSPLLTTSPENKPTNKKETITQNPYKYKGQPIKVPFKGQFDLVWARYPVKSGKDRALRAYEKARKAGTTHDEIDDGLTRYLAYVASRRANGFRDLNHKNGDTWFNQNGWRDEYGVAEQDEYIPANKRHWPGGLI